MRFIWYFLSLFPPSFPLFYYFRIFCLFSSCNCLLFSPPTFFTSFSFIRFLTQRFFSLWFVSPLPIQHASSRETITMLVGRRNSFCSLLCTSCPIPTQGTHWYELFPVHWLSVYIVYVCVGLLYTTRYLLSQNLIDKMCRCKMSFAIIFQLY